MRDSWIDRDELDELVGSFSPAKKGKGRRVAARPKKAAVEVPSSPDPAAEVAEEVVPLAGSASQVAATIQAAPEPDIHSGDLRAGTAGPMSEAIIPEEAMVEALAVFELDDEIEDAGDMEPESPSAQEPCLPLSEPIPEVIEISILEAEEFPHHAPSLEESPPPLPVLDERDPEPLETLDPDDPDDEASDSLTDPAAEPELIVSPAQEEVLREVPLFLDDADDFVPRHPSLTERDADRALIALAEARAKAEQGRLLRTHRVEPASDGVAPGCDETEESPEDGPVLLSVSGEVDPLVPDYLVIDPVEPPEAESLSLSDRIEQYVIRAREELGASAAAISDRDGFLLFAQSDPGLDEDLGTALLLEVAGKTEQLLGLDRGSATQVSADGGAWRCLIRGGDGAAELYAGFRMMRPLDQEEIIRWRKALAELLPAPLE